MFMQSLMSGPLMVACSIGLLSAQVGNGSSAARSDRLVAASALQPPIPGPVQFGKVPVLSLPPQPPVSREEAAKIKQLVASLANIDSPDFGLSSTLTGTAFAPVAGSEQVGALLLTAHQIKPSEALRELVRLGPRALPFLLAALDDRTPTHLTIRHNGMFGVMEFAHEIWGNPVNPIEQKALASVPKSRWGATRSPGDIAHVSTKSSNPWDAARLAYTVTIGDVCFVAIGQIVGRNYQAVRYQPTMCIMINSPPHDPALAAQVRAVWASEDPAQHLLHSLLLDYRSPGLDEYSRFKPGAAMRLLYYFPHITAPMIAERLNRLGVAGHGPGAGSEHTQAEMEAARKQDVANGVDAKQLVKSASWCREPAIRAAVLDIFQRTTDPDILIAALPGIDGTHEALVRARVDAFLERLPSTEGGPYADGFNLLAALADRLGASAKPAFERYLQDASPQHCQTMCRLVCQTRHEWDLELLIPLLADRRPIERWRYPVVPGQEQQMLPMRVCDEAARALSTNHPELKFKMEGTHADLDQQIEVMKQRIHAGVR